MAKYNVRIKTKNVTYAGTDSTIAIYFYGPNGQSGTPGNGWITLDNWGNDFEPGDDDVYEVEGNLNGPITCIELAVDGSDEWQPEWVIIEDVDAGLFWRADLSDAPIKNNIARKQPVLVPPPAPPSTSKMDRERQLAEAWLKNYGEGIAMVCKQAASSPALLASALLQHLNEIGFSAKFVSIGGGLNAGAGYAYSIDGGGVFPVQQNRMLGDKVANYMTLSYGWDISIGASAGAVVAAWNVPTIEGLDGESLSCHLSVQAGLGIAVSAIFSKDSLGPTGVQIAMLAGPDVSLGGGSMRPYTWTWRV